MEKQSKKGVRAAIIVIGVVLLLIAAAVGVRLFTLSHKTTTTLQYLSKVPYQDVYYANGAGTHAVVRVESAIDLTRYCSGYDDEIEVSGAVTRLTVGHFDCMGLMLPCVSYEFRVDAVLKPDAPVEVSDAGA